MNTVKTVSHVGLAASFVGMGVGVATGSSTVFTISTASMLASLGGIVASEVLFPQSVRNIARAKLLVAGKTTEQAEKILKEAASVILDVAAKDLDKDERKELKKCSTREEVIEFLNKHGKKDEAKMVERLGETVNELKEIEEPNTENVAKGLAKFAQANGLLGFFKSIEGLLRGKEASPKETVKAKGKPAKAKGKVKAKAKP